MSKTAIFIEKKEYIQALKELLSERFLSQEYEIITLRADVEMRLEKEGLPFVSAKAYRDLDYQARMSFVEETVAEIINSSSLQFWYHRGISLGALNRISIQDYLVQLLYWYGMISAFLAERHYEKIIVLASADVDETTKALSNRKLGIIRTAVSMCLEATECEVEVLLVPREQAMGVSAFKLKCFLLFVRIINFLVTYTRRKKELSLVVSDTWRNIESYLSELQEAEVILWERSEMVAIGWKNILKYRMRFMHADEFRERPNQGNASEAHARISAWKERDRFIKKRFLWKGKDLTEHIMDTFGEVIDRTYGDTLLIEDVFSMLEKTKPDAVLVRASASTQLHFPVLCLVAAELGIASIEAQHGLFYLGPTSVPRHSSASKIAMYGHLASEEMRAVGYEGDLLNIGSPRFDVYSTIEHVRTDEKEFTVLVVLPDDTTGLWFDTYDIIELLILVKVLFETNPQVKVILKARPGAPAAVFGIEMAQKLFSGFLNCRVAISEPLGTLYQEVDVTVSVLSTIILESFAARVPLIYLANAKFHNAIVESHLAIYQQEGGMKVVRTEKEFCSAVASLMELPYYIQLQTQASDFVKHQFSFESGSPKRMAEVIRNAKSKSS